MHNSCISDPEIGNPKLDDRILDFKFRISGSETQESFDFEISLSCGIREGCYALLDLVQTFGQFD